MTERHSESEAPGLAVLEFSLALVLAILLSGCVSKASADARARAAYLAGQQEAILRQQQQQPQQPQAQNITVIGAVRNNFVPWTADLTLANALLTADYVGQKDPTEIVVNRNGVQIRIDPKKLLGGEDMPLQPRDVIEIR